MGDCILSSLSAAPENRPTKPEEQSCTESLSDQLQGFSEETQPVTFVEDVSVEMITVTEYAEVELGATTDIEVMVEEKNDLAENDTVVVLSENVSRDKEEDKITEDKLLNGSENVVINKESEVTQHKLILGPHDCPDCDKKFKFASSLSSHRVIRRSITPDSEALHSLFVLCCCSSLISSTFFSPLLSSVALFPLWSVCVFRCLASASSQLNVLLHCRHSKTPSFMCVCLCSVWADSETKVSPHTTHPHLFADFWCVFLCLSRDCLKEKHRPHSEHL